MVSGREVSKRQTKVIPREAEVQEMQKNTNPRWNGRIWSCPVNSQPCSYSGSHSRNACPKRGRCGTRIRHKCSQPKEGAQRHGGSALKQQSFKWNASEDGVEVLNFKMEVTNILQMKMYELTEEEKVPIIKNWLGREGLQLIKTFTNETCKTARGLFSTLSEKFMPWHNQMVLLLQNCKHKGKSYESVQEWMDRLWTKAADCE